MQREHKESSSDWKSLRSRFLPSGGALSSGLGELWFNGFGSAFSLLSFHARLCSRVLWLVTDTQGRGQHTGTDMHCDRAGWQWAVRAAWLREKPALCAFLTGLAWVLRGALILQIQADRNEEEKEKGRLFSEKQAYPLMGTKNKPSSTGIIYITLPESSSATPVKHPGSHKIPSRKHTVVRKLKFIIQVAINQRVLKTTAVGKQDLGNVASTVQVLSFEVQFKKPKDVVHLSATLRVQRGESLYMFTRAWSETCPAL